jgi:hypothetical protein
LLDAVDRQGQRSAPRRDQHVLEHDAVLLAAQQDLAREHEHVDRAAVLDRELGHRRIGPFGDEQLAAGPRLIERANRQRRRAAGSMEPEDREPTIGAALTDTDTFEKPSEIGAGRAGAGRRLASTSAREHSDPVRSRRRRHSDHARSHTQHLQEASSGHAPTLPAGGGRARRSVVQLDRLAAREFPRGLPCPADGALP